MQLFLSRNIVLPYILRLFFASACIIGCYLLHLALRSKWAGMPPIGGWMVPVILITALSGISWGIVAAIVIVVIRTTLLRDADDAAGLFNIVNFVVSSGLIFVAVAIHGRRSERILSRAMNDAAAASIANLVRNDIGNAVLFDDQMRFIAASKSWQEEFMPRQYWNNYEGVCHYDMLPWTLKEFGASHKKVLAGEQIENLSQQFSDDTGKNYYHSWRMMPWRQLNGKISGAVLFGVNHRDVFELGERQQGLIAELNHRTKNVLAIVGAIASQTALKAAPHVFVETFRTRLKGLARTYDLLLHNQNEGAELRDLVDAHLDWSIYGTRISRDCCKTFLSPSAAQSIGVALNELLTNAIKHGSLSNNEGSVQIVATIQTSADEAVLRITWKECGGPKIAATINPSYGLELLTQKTEHSLNAEVQACFEPDGFYWECSAPLNQVATAP